MLVYLTHVYSRLVHTPPIYVTAFPRSSQTIDENEKNGAKESFILHRRHIPLTKKIEIGKLYPHLNAFVSCKPIVEELFIKIDYPHQSLKSLLIEYCSNKAPPQLFS
jgi:hypothetical protein